MMWLIGSEIRPKTKDQRLKYKEYFCLRFKRSFTLIELLVVVIIISTLVIAGLPRFRNTFNNLKFDDFCQSLVSKIVYLRERACAEQNTYRLNFDLNNRIIKTEARGRDAEEFVAVAGILGRTIKIPEGIKIEIQDDNIFFYPDGTINSKDCKISGFQNKAIISIKETIGAVKLEKNE